MAWLLTWLVQSVALGAATAALVCLPGFRARASARVSAWSVALAGIAALAVMPLLTWPEAEAAGRAFSAFPSAAPAAAQGPFVLPVIPGVWLAAGLAIWAAGAAAWMGWVARELTRVLCLKRISQPWTDLERRRLAPWVETLLQERGARVAWCDRLDGPALLGFGGPVIAVPREHGARLTDEALQHVLLHEAAHLRRRDDWASLLELAVAGLLWINPAVHVARRALGLAREMACDDWVVRQTSAPVAYATCLTAVASLRRGRHRTSLVAAATSTPSVLARRVTRVLDQDRRRGAGAARWFALMTPVAVGALAIALIQAPPVVIDGRADAGAQRPADPSAPARLPADVRAIPAADAMPFPPPQTGIGPQKPVGAQPPPAVRPAAPAAESVPVPVSPGEPGSPGEARVADVPLQASPVPGVGTAGVSVAAPSTSTRPMLHNESSPWWGRAARVGTATSEKATAAGQSTASLFKRLGSSVSQALTR